MIQVCGDNNNLLLCAYPNNKSAFGSPVISPPINSPIDSSSILCYSIYYCHSVIITKNYKTYGIGDNRDHRITTSLPSQKFAEMTEITIKNGENISFLPIAAVCGYKYTLYIVINTENNNSRHLLYSSKQTKSENPLFLDIGNSIPMSLFGGRNDSAAIDSEGGIIYIPGESIKVVYSKLPNGEKAVNIACCNKYVFALSSSGRLFQSFSGHDIEFSEVSELNGIEIIGLSGTWFHCLAVSKDGEVFGQGENYCGQLGFEKDICEVNKFKKIESLNNYKIKAAYAGGTHSLFQTIDGKILACGCNFYGQLLLETGPSHEKIFKPIETTIKSDASFCIAGDSISIVFSNFVPQNNPNMNQ